MNNLNTISEKIIGCAFNVSNTLGAGFLEKVYQNALMIELVDKGLFAEKEKAINLHLGLLINFGTPKVQIKRLVNGK